MYVTKYKDKYRAWESYTDTLGNYKKVSVVMDKNTAQSRKKAAEQLQKKMNAPSDRMTYSELVEMYIQYQSAVFRQSTWKRNEASLKRLSSLFGKKPVADMTAGFITSALFAKTKEAGTYNEYLKRVKAMFRWAYRSDLIPSSACVDKIQPLKDSGRKDKITDKYLEPEELKAVLAAASDYYAPIFEFLALSGLRIGELIALDNEDVTDTEIIVRRTYDFRHDVMNDPKTAAGIRAVHIQPELKSAIHRIRKNTKENCFRYAVKLPYFVVSPQLGRLSYDKANRVFKDLCARLVGRELTLHALRHTHVALMAANGISFEAIARRIGHSGTKVTKEIYYHVTEKQKEKDAAAFDAVSIFN